MERSGFITAVLLAAVVPIAACNYAYSDRDAVDSRDTHDTRRRLSGGNIGHVAGSRSGR